MNPKPIALHKLCHNVPAGYGEIAALDIEAPPYLYREHDSQQLKCVSFAVQLFPVSFFNKEIT